MTPSMPWPWWGRPPRPPSEAPQTIEAVPELRAPVPIQGPGGNDGGGSLLGGGGLL